MKNTIVQSSGSIGLGGVIFLIFLIVKLTEKCTFWGDGFPRFLESTPAWWDGWFIVFLPILIPLMILAVLLIFYLGFWLIFKAISKN